MSDVLLVRMHRTANYLVKFIGSFCLMFGMTVIEMVGY